jgi:hypothetical protein
MTHVIVQGTSEPQDFALLDDGVALVGTDLTVNIEVYLNAVLVTSSPPTVAWLNQAGGTVRVSGVENLAVGSYQVRFKLTARAGKIAYCPNLSSPDRWRVLEP